MMKIIWIVCILVGLTSGQKPLPKYIDACRRNDPNLNECFANKANRAMRQMLRGDPDYGIPSLLPLKHEDVDFIAPTLKLFLQDIQIHGAEHMEVVDPQLDLSKNLIKFYFTNPMIIWEGDYTAHVDTPTGKVQKNGHVNLHFAMGKFLMTYQFILEDRNGTNYAKIVLAREEVVTTNLSIEASKEHNALADEEWDYMKPYILNDDFLLICARTIKFFIQQILNVVPYDDVFPL